MIHNLFLKGFIFYLLISKSFRTLKAQKYPSILYSKSLKILLCIFWSLGRFCTSCEVQIQFYFSLCIEPIISAVFIKEFLFPYWSAVPLMLNLKFPYGPGSVSGFFVPSTVLFFLILLLIPHYCNYHIFIIKS